MVLPAGLAGECGEGEMHEPAEGRAHVAVLSPRLRQEGIIYRLQFDTGSQSFLNSFKGDVLSRFSFPMDSSKEKKAKEEEKEEKEESKSEPEKAEYVSFLCPFLCVSVFHSSSAFGDAVGRISGYKVTPVISVEASSSVGGDQCKHLPGEVWGALLSLSGSMRNLFVCFSAETTL